MFRKNTLKKNQLFYRPRMRRAHVEIPQLRWLFSNTVKGGLTVLISVLVIFTVVKANTSTFDNVPSGEPVANFYSLSEIYNLIANNTTSTEGSPALDWSSALEGTGYTLTEIYDALVAKIALINPVKILTGETYFGKPGTMANNGAFALTASSTEQTIAEGYYSGGTLPAASSTDLDLKSDNVRDGIDIFGVIGNMVAGWLYGDNDDPAQVLTTAGNGGDGSGGGTFDVSNLSNEVIKKGITWGDGLGSTGLFFGDTVASYVLTTADGGGAAKGTYNALNLSSTTVKKGTAFGVSSTGAYSGYPGSAWAGSGGPTNANTCEWVNGIVGGTATGWYWFEDGNGDGDENDPEDGICIQAASHAAAASWNGYDYDTNYDATYIASYTCTGSFPNGSVNVDSYNGITTGGAADTHWDDGDCALCQIDCLDGVKDLPNQGSYTCGGGCAGGVGGYNGPLTPEALSNWKGTRSPSSAEFFGFCSTGGTNSGVGEYETSCSSDVTGGDYGVQVGRIGECIDPIGWEWLSEQHIYYYARIAGNSACSYFNHDSVNYGYRFRAVFRP